MFGRILRATGTVLVTVVAFVTPVLASSTPASADTVVDGCTIVSNPTPTNFTNCPGANLSGADLSGVNLSYANFAGADFIFGLDFANLSGADLSNANLSSAGLAGVDLSNANLSSADLTSATLVFCFLDFSVASCPITTLHGASLTGATLADATLATCSNFSSAPFGSGCGTLDLSGIDLSGANFAGATFVACQPPGVSPPGCHGANLAGATLTGVNLTDLNLTDVNLTGATLTGATLTGATLTGTVLVPSDQIIAATGKAGAVVTWPTPPSLSGATPGTCTPPPSGSTFPPGTTTITCQVLDDQGDVATGTFAVTVVIPVQTATSLSTSPNPSLVDLPVTYTATVSPTPTEGTVSFTDNGSPILGCSGPGVPLSGGIATCATSTPTTTGNHTIVATYGGSVAFLGSTSPSVTQVVVNSLQTTTGLSSSANPVVLGQSVTYTATVSPTPIGGTVAFTDNGSPIARCTAVSLLGDSTTCSTTPSATGAHIIVASYSGSGGFVGSMSPSLTEVVVPPPPPGFAIITSSLPSATPGVAYGPVTLQESGAGTSTSPNVTTLKWKKVALPKGLKLSSAGVLSGTLNKKLAVGPNSATVQVTEKVTTLTGRMKVKTETTVQATIPLTIT